jgi:transglutaminase-like putative cysteine protease
MMFRPRDSFDQRMLSATLTIEPEPARLHWIHDVYDNCVTLASFSGETTRLAIESEITLDHTPHGGPDFALEERARTFPFAYGFEEMPDIARAIERQFPDPDGELDRWVHRFLQQGRPTDTAEMLMTLTYAIKESFVYERRSQHGVQDPLHTLARGRGSCRDFAVLMMEAVRALGLAARFVTGYLYVPDRDHGERYQGGGSTHAWCQVYLPGAGWVEFDPTNGIVGSRDLVRVAVARDPRQAIPLSGSFFGSLDDEAGMTVMVNVRRTLAEELAHVGAR